METEAVNLAVQWVPNAPDSGLHYCSEVEDLQQHLESGGSNHSIAFAIHSARHESSRCTQTTDMTETKPPQCLELVGKHGWNGEGDGGGKQSRCLE